MRVARKPRRMTEARILNWLESERLENWVSKIETRTKSATESSIIIEGMAKHRNMQAWTRCKGKEMV